MAINIRYIVLLSLIFFFISLSQIVFFDSINQKSHINGLIILIYGWGGIFEFNLINISWLGNLTLILSWFNFKRLNISFNYSVLSLFFGLFFLVYDFFIKEFQNFNYGIGLYFWLSSILIMFLGNLFFIIQKITYSPT